LLLTDNNFESANFFYGCLEEALVLSFYFKQELFGLDLPKGQVK
jgi:hypothetical protein